MTHCLHHCNCNCGCKTNLRDSTEDHLCSLCKRGQHKFQQKQLPNSGSMSKVLLVLENFQGAWWSNITLSMTINYSRKQVDRCVKILNDKGLLDFRGRYFRTKLLKKTIKGRKFGEK